MDMANSTFPMSPNPPNTVAEFSMLFLIVGELIGHLLLECPFSALNLRLIWTTSVLHFNLKFILICQSSCIFVRGAMRTVFQLFHLSNVRVGQSGEKILLGLYMFPMNLRNHIPHILVIERFMATIFAKSYEQWTNPCFTIIWSSVVIFFSAFGAIKYAKVERPTTASFITDSVLFVLCGVETVAFFWLWLRNSKTYSRRHAVGGQQQQRQRLSERYQLAENIRTTKQLAPTLLLHLTNLTIVTAGNFLYCYNMPNAAGDAFYLAFITQIQFTLITYSNFLIELTILINHPFLQHKLNWLWQKCVPSCAWNNNNNNRVGDSNNGIQPAGAPNERSQQYRHHHQQQQRRQRRQSQKAAIGLTDMSGKAMALTQNQDAYFSQLTKFWERKARESTSFVFPMAI
uniref:Gustatory receptor n=1 Tax=Globodera rostochiensis TaxID=31243 RepID=A0A914IE31_GLORO